MYWELTDDIWWGDCRAIGSNEAGEKVGSVICVAANKEMITYGYNPLVLPPGVRYFRLAERDMAFPDDLYMNSMEEVIKIALRYKPLLVHCFIGQHRSPIIAIMAAMIDSGKKFNRERYDKFVKKVMETRPECAEVWEFNYTSTVQRWIKNRISENFRV